MATKPKKTPSAPAEKKPVAPPPPPPPPESVFRVLFTEIRHHPSLATGIVFLILTAFSISAVVQFRDNMNMGAIREPTGTVFLGAITLTLFGSYWWQRKTTKP